MSPAPPEASESSLDLKVFSNGRWWPWLVALAILAFLLWRTPLDELSTAFHRGPGPVLALFSAIAVLIAFVADLWATRVGLGALGVDVPPRDLLMVRGTSHLLGLLNFTVGQGTIGYYLVRQGVSKIRATVAVLYLVVVTLVGLLALGAVGLALGPAIGATWTRSLVAVGSAVLLVAAGFLLLRPRWLRESALWRSIFASAPGAHAAAVASRIVHFLLFTLLYWVALRIWGVPVSLRAAIGVIAILLFIAALPITPYGIGTVQAAQILLLSPLMPQTEAAAREASILAFGLIHFVASLAAQAVLGFLCYLGWRRLAARQAAVGPAPPLSRRPPTPPRPPTGAG